MFYFCSNRTCYSLFVIIAIVLLLFQYQLSPRLSNFPMNRKFIFKWVANFSQSAESAPSIHQLQFDGVPILFLFASNLIRALLHAIASNLTCLSRILHEFLSKLALRPENRFSVYPLLKRDTETPVSEQTHRTNTMITIIIITIESRLTLTSPRVLN